MQGTFDELGTPLHEVTFCVFDLETTGGAPDDAAITEIGAVKVRGGEVVGEFSTLVDPGTAIPPFISVLTGITDGMVAAAPRLEVVLPMFLEFAHGTVLVAHNAPFDMRFLRAACRAHGYADPRAPVVDTADLARRVLTRDEVPDRKLATLATFFRAAERPRHRALADARATVDVLHGLVERLGCFSVTTLEEMTSFARAPTPQQRRKRHLADGLPPAPGVYMFQDERGDVLYVGKSDNVRTRVRSYFTAAETRRRVREMIGLADRVVPLVCDTGLEAEVRELRLIAAHNPRYNRRSRFPERAVWVKLTAEPFPRLTVARKLGDAAAYLGPFSSTRPAEAARAALLEAVPLRQCTGRLTARRGWAACALAEMGRCGAPCEGRESAEEYARHVRTARAAMTADARPVVAAMRARLERLSAYQRYEEAAGGRDRLAAFLRGAARAQRLTALADCAQVVAARPAFSGGWDLAVIRYGRLAGSASAPPGTDPPGLLPGLLATAESVPHGDGRGLRAVVEETECLLRWLESPGTRLLDLDGRWSCPRHGAEGLLPWIERAYGYAGRQD